jgi:hypothetical protein
MKRISEDFPDSEADVVTQLGEVESGNQDRERVIAALVLGASGDRDLLCQLIELSKLDWRDVLVIGGLDATNWPHILDLRLG